jgi:hypothetical protein
MSNTFEYDAIEVKQTPSAKPFYVTSVSAEQLLAWCDVPRKKEDFMAGYQRELDDRHQKITEFFTSDPVNNIIPNAVIVALDSAATEVDVDPKTGHARIRVSLEDLTLTAAVNRVLGKFRARLSKEEADSIALGTGDSTSSTPDDGSGDDEDEDAVPPQSYLSVLTSQLEEASKDLNSLPQNLRDALADYVVGVTKPGLIIDGQHRVFGAKNVNDFEVKLPVILIPGLSYQEQVFHFYVLNNKARPLSKTELRTIVSTSLGKKEIGDLYDRFKQVGVTAEQTEWTYRMNTDSASPFRGLVNMGLSGSSGPIPENVAYQVVSKFVSLPKKYRLLYSDVPEWNGPNKYQYRLSLFFALWRGVMTKYSTAWSDAAKGANKQMLQKVALVNLQQHLLDQLNAEMPRRKAKGEASPFADPDALAAEIGFLLDFLKEEFFTKEWKLKGLDTAEGHKTFRGAISDAIAAQSANLGNMKLFKSTK